MTPQLEMLLKEIAMISFLVRFRQLPGGFTCAMCVGTAAWGASTPAAPVARHLSPLNFDAPITLQAVNIPAGRAFRQVFGQLGIHLKVVPANLLQSKRLNLRIANEPAWQAAWDLLNRAGVEVCAQAQVMGITDAAHFAQLYSILPVENGMPLIGRLDPPAGRLICRAPTAIFRLEDVKFRQFFHYGQRVPAALRRVTATIMLYADPNINFNIQQMNTGITLTRMTDSAGNSLLLPDEQASLNLQLSTLLKRQAAFRAVHHGLYSPKLSVQIARDGQQIELFRSRTLKRFSALRPIPDGCGVQQWLPSPLPCIVFTVTRAAMAPSSGGLGEICGTVPMQLHEHWHAIAVRLPPKGERTFTLRKNMTLTVGAAIHGSGFGPQFWRIPCSLAIHLAPRTGVAPQIRAVPSDSAARKLAGVFIRSLRANVYDAAGIRLGAAREYAWPSTPGHYAFNCVVAQPAPRTGIPIRVVFSYSIHNRHVQATFDFKNISTQPAAGAVK